MPATRSKGSTRADLVLPNEPESARFLGFSLVFWAMVVLTGIGAGIGAGLLMHLLRFVQHVCYDYQSGSFLVAVQHALPARRVIVLIGAGLLAMAGLLLLRDTPGANAGELNERIWFHSGLMPELKTVAKAALSITIVGMGASLGRETAPKQAGAAVASALSRLFGLTSAESRLLAACGAGAGMGAVYNVPLGGALFTLEVLLGTMALPLIPPALAASVIATAVSWTMLPNQPTYTIPSFSISASQIGWALVFGPVAGLASVAYTRLIVGADRIKPRKGIALVLPVVVLGGLGALSIPYPQLLGNGKDVVESALSDGLGFPLLLALVVLKPLATAACVGSGAPGGLFTPTMSFGAMLGGVLGRVWSLFWPGASPGSYVLVGSAAVLAATMQAPVAAIVLVFELAHHVAVQMVPILVAVAGAAVTARRLDPRSIYSGRIHSGRQAAGAEPRPDAIAAVFGDLPTRTFETISVAASYTEILERFVAAAGDPKPLYALDEKGCLAGRIDPGGARSPDPLTPVLSTAAAGDLMVRVVPLAMDLSRAEALARLAREPAGELPVVDADSGRIVGVALPPGAARP